MLSVASTGTSLAVLMLAAFFGVLSALLAVTTLADRSPGFAEPSLAFTTGLVVWLGVGWWLARRAFVISAVVRRSCGLGAWQWLLLLLLHEPVAAASSSESTRRGDWLDDLLPLLSGSLGIFMLWVCAGLYALMWWGRRQRLDPPAPA